MALADLERLRPAPRFVSRARAIRGRSRQTWKLLCHAGGQETEEERLELLAIPPAVDVALPEAERAVREHATAETFVVDLRVPRRVSVEPETRGREEVLESASASGHT